MMKMLRFPALLLLSLMILFSMSLPALGAEEQQNPWNTVKGKPSEERNQIYESIVVSTEGWEKGKVLNKDPFVVVTEYTVDAPEVKAKVRIWTGVLARVDDDLTSMWDEIWIGIDNKVYASYTDKHDRILNYFAAPLQNEFQNLNYAGRYPWISVPTDTESIKTKTEPVPNDGMIDTYGLLASDESADIVKTNAVKIFPAIPNKLHAERIFATKVITVVPKDIEKHWAKESALDLMSKQIVAGYLDSTLKPDKTVVRAEFISMLMKGLQWTPTGKELSTYADLDKHWAKSNIGLAEQLGLLSQMKQKTNFNPNQEITRMEMTQILSKALLILDRTDSGSAVNFKDINKLSSDDQLAISRVVNHGIMVGDLDGKFHPEGKLTRAQAFVVVSRLIYV